MKFIAITVLLVFLCGGLLLAACTVAPPAPVPEPDSAAEPAVEPDPDPTPKPARGPVPVPDPAPGPAPRGGDGLPAVAVTYNAIYVRSGPSGQHADISFVGQGEILIPLGRGPQSEWLYVAIPNQNDLEGWVWAAYTSLDAARLAALPLQEFTPVPTVAPEPPPAEPAPAPAEPAPVSQDPTCRHVRTDSQPVPARRGPGTNYPFVIDHPADTDLAALGTAVDATGRMWVQLAHPAFPLYYPEFGRIDFEQEWLPAPRLQLPCVLPQVAAGVITPPLTFEFVDHSARFDWYWNERGLWDDVAVFYAAADIQIHHIRLILADWPFGMPVLDVWNERVTPFWEQNLPYDYGMALAAGLGPRYTNNPDLYVQEYDSIRDAILAGQAPPVELPITYTGGARYCHTGPVDFTVMECVVLPLYSQGNLGPLEGSVTAQALNGMQGAGYWTRYNAEMPRDYRVVTHRFSSLTTGGQADARGFYATVDSRWLTLAQVQPWPWEE